MRFRCLAQDDHPNEVFAARRSLQHFLFDGRPHACLFNLGPPCRMASEDEEMALSAVTTFTGGFDTLLREVLSLSVPRNLRAFSMAQKANALIFFAASEIALPSLSSLVASCKISESSATKRPRIKIQANIVPSLRRLPLRRQIFPRPLVVRKQIVKDRP